MEKNVAIAKLRVYNGVPGFDLYFNNSPYGHYPCDNDRWTESMRQALIDAQDNGFSGILFQ